MNGLSNTTYIASAWPRVVWTIGVCGSIRNVAGVALRKPPGV